MAWYSHALITKPSASSPDLMRMTIPPLINGSGITQDAVLDLFRSVSLREGGREGREREIHR